jgi:hypothetical protein
MIIVSSQASYQDIFPKAVGYLEGPLGLMLLIKWVKGILSDFIDDYKREC